MPSDRSCSPLPARNRQDHQGQRRSLPCFPRWCGPMGSAVQNLPNMSRPQMIPKWPPCQPGPSGMGRMMTPQLPQSWTMSQPFPPVPPSMPPPSTIASSPMLGRLPTQACPPTQACSPLNHVSHRLSPVHEHLSNPTSIHSGHTTDASHVYGFDLNENWMGDRAHYDNQKINGLTGH